MLHLVCSPSVSCSIPTVVGMQLCCALLLASSCICVLVPVQTLSLLTRVHLHLHKPSWEVEPHIFKLQVKEGPDPLQKHTQMAMSSPQMLQRKQTWPQAPWQPHTTLHTHLPTLKPPHHAMLPTQPWRFTQCTRGMLPWARAVTAVSLKGASGLLLPRTHMPGQMAAMGTTQRMHPMQAMGIIQFMGTIWTMTLAMVRPPRARSRPYTERPSRMTRGLA